AHTTMQVAERALRSALPAGESIVREIGSATSFSLPGTPARRSGLQLRRQVSWLADCRFSPPSRARSQWRPARNIPPTVAGTAAAWGIDARTAFPLSLPPFGSRTVAAI